MNQPEPPEYIVVKPVTLRTPEGPVIEYSFLSRTFKDHDPDRGNRQWRAVVDDPAVDSWEGLHAANTVARVWGGFAMEREQMIGLLESELTVLRLEESQTRPDPDIMRLTPSSAPVPEFGGFGP